LPTMDLPPHAKCEGRISSNIRIGNEWLFDPKEAFEKVYSRLKN
jgi:hypothetical protein